MEGLTVPVPKQDRAGFGRIHVHCRTDPLAGDLHQAELAQRQDVVFSPVISHRLSSCVRTAFCRLAASAISIKSTNDDTTHVAQAELTGDLVGGGRVHVDSRLLLGIAAFGAVPAVHVDNVHGFRVLDNQVGSTLVRDGTSE